MEMVSPAAFGPLLVGYHTDPLCGVVAVPAASNSRAHRPSRLSNVYPLVGQNGVPNMGQNGVPLDAQQQQQMQMQLQAQAHARQSSQQLHGQHAGSQQALQQQQLLQQHQQQQYAQQARNQVPSHGGARDDRGQQASQKRRKHDDGPEAEEEGEEGADGEDLTPYCFCHRPSFGEVRSPSLTDPSGCSYGMRI